MCASAAVLMIEQDEEQVCVTRILLMLEPGGNFCNSKYFKLICHLVEASKIIHKPLCEDHVTYPHPQKPHNYAK